MAKRTKEQEQRLSVEIVRQMLTLATSGFGLVAALAWNELVKALVEGYVKKYLPAGSQVISLLVYALVVTILAVVITMQLSKLLRGIEELNNRKKK